jgi:ADP-ribose pyrophosphatase YjhB (NUDIX family)
MNSRFSMALKQKLAHWLRNIPPLRWGLALAVRLLVPRQYVGAVGAVFNEQGQVLLVKHVFRPFYPWGLPGGWLERGEDPALAVRRECEEELGLRVEVRQLLICKPQGQNIGAPPGLGLAYYCRLAGGESATNGNPTASKAYEILAVEWAEPTQIEYDLAPLERRAITLARQVFEREQAANKETGLKDG